VENPLLGYGKISLPSRGFQPTFGFPRERWDGRKRLGDREQGLEAGKVRNYFIESGFVCHRHGVWRSDTYRV
jgi:hypothetical protein